MKITLNKADDKLAKAVYVDFAERIREVLMNDASQTFGKAGDALLKLRPGSSKEFRTNPLIIKVTKIAKNEDEMSVRIEISGHDLRRAGTPNRRSRTGKSVAKNGQLRQNLTMPK